MHARPPVGIAHQSGHAPQKAEIDEGMGVIRLSLDAHSMEGWMEASARLALSMTADGNGDSCSDQRPRDSRGPRGSRRPRPLTEVLVEDGPDLDGPVIYGYPN